MPDIVTERVPLLCHSGSEPSPRRIRDLREVRRYIDDLDLRQVRARLTSGAEELGQGWSAPKADYYLRLYRNWLFLWRKHEGEHFAPQVEVDCCWHEHILNTRVYFADCDHIFGYYLHHFPGFGKRGPEDAENLREVWRDTQKRYRAEYGDYIYDFDE